MKRELLSVNRDEIVVDTEFAAKYGVPLATRRARFLRDEHPAWQIWGLWMRDNLVGDSVVYNDGLCKSLIAAVDAGVFFSDMDPFVDVEPTLGTRKGAMCQLWKWYNHEARTWRVRLMRGLYARPHFLPVIDEVLKAHPFVIDVDLSGPVDSDIFYKTRDFMTREEKEQWLTKALRKAGGVGVGSLDYYDDMNCGAKNLVFTFCNEFKFMPDAVVSEVVQLACTKAPGDESIRKYGEYKDDAFKSLLHADQGVLRQAMTDVSERDLLEMVDEVLQEMDGSCRFGWWEGGHLSNMLRYAAKPLTFEFVRRVFLTWFRDCDGPWDVDEVEYMGIYFALCKELTVERKEALVQEGEELRAQVNNEGC